MRRWRHRPLQAVAVAVLAALVVACAGFAPLYYRAMQQSLTGVSLDNAPFVATSVQLSSTPSGASYDPRPPTPAEAVAGGLARRYRSDFHAPVLGYEASSAVDPRRHVCERHAGMELVRAARGDVDHTCAGDGVDVARGDECAPVREFAGKLLSAPDGSRRRVWADSGYFVPHWPRPWGRAAGPVEQLVIEQELAGIPRPGMGIG